MTASTAAPGSPPASAAGAAGRPLRPSVLLHVFLTVVALGWLAPLLLALYASLRPYQETAELRLLLLAATPVVRLLQRGVGPGRTAASTSSTR